MSNPPPAEVSRLRALPNFIFASRWLQLPLYLGLIVAQCVYVFHFWVELVHLVEAAFGNSDALAKLVTSIGYKSDTPSVTSLNETIIMLVVLALIDVVMISNLLMMVIVGGYETFVSRMRLGASPRPAGMVEPRQRQRAEGEAGHRHHRHQQHPPAEDLHQCEQLHREGVAVADADPHHVPALGTGHCVDRPAHELRQKAGH